MCLVWGCCIGGALGRVDREVTGLASLVLHLLGNVPIEIGIVIGGVWL